MLLNMTFNHKCFLSPSPKVILSLTLYSQTHANQGILDNDKPHFHEVAMVLHVSTNGMCATWLSLGEETQREL